MGHQRVLGLVALSVLAGACSTSGSAGSAPVAEKVAARPRHDVPGRAAVGRFHLELAPKAGRMDLFRLHEGDVIYREAPMATPAAIFNYGGGTTQNNDCDPAGLDPDLPSCAALANVINLYTDQSQVTYIEDGDCYRNGAFFDNDVTCGGLYTDVGNPCRGERMFCGPLRLISFYTQGGTRGALPNVILDIGEESAGSVETCRDDASGSFGACESAAANAIKIDPVTSAFEPAIPAGLGASDRACTLCYGNFNAASGATGLRNAVVSGTAGSHPGINTNRAAIKIADTWDSNAGLNVTLDVFFSTPALETGSQLSYRTPGGAPLTCYTPSSQAAAGELTQIQLTGNSFGPQAECYLDTPGASCSSTTPGTPADSRYRLGFEGLAAVDTPSAWSDTLVRSSTLDQGVYGCGVTVQTAAGNVTSTSEVQVCGDTYRGFVPTGAVDLWRRHWASSAVLGNDLLLVGGQNTADAYLSTVSRIPLPRCGAANPTPVAVTTTLPTGLGLSRAQSVEVDDQLYIYGGRTAASNCSGVFARLAWNGTTATWTTLTSPTGEGCRYGGTAMLLTDSANGNRWIVVIGGRNNGNNNLSSGRAYNLATGTWLSYTLPTTARGLVNGASNGTTGVFMNSTGGTFTVRMQTAAGGTSPTLFFASVSSPGTPASADRIPSFTHVNGTYYAFEGQTLKSWPGTGTWTTLSSSIEAHRQGATLVPAQFDEPVFSDKTRLLVVGGTGVVPTMIEEFNP